MCQEELNKNNWQKWDLMDRLDYCARAVSKNGFGVPAWVLSISYIKLLIVHLLFFLILYLVPPNDLDSSSGQYQVFARFVIYVQGVLALGEFNGPPARWSGGVPGTLGLFVLARHRLTPGTLKEPFSYLQCLGYRRTVLDVVVYVVFLVASSIFVASTEFAIWPYRLVCMCITWFIIFDFNDWHSSNGPTFYGVLFSLCLPLDSGGRACAQFHMMCLWVGSGLAKMGPWFSEVNKTFVCSSPLLSRQPWLWRLMHRGENDLRPTPLAAVFGRIAATVEWGAPMVFLVSTEPLLIWSAVALLVAMHLYIVMLCGVDLRMWNAYSAWVAIYLFVCASPPLGFDYVGWSYAPWYFQAFNVLQVVLFALGSIFPDSVDYKFSHRHWAGNWPMAVWLLRKDASAKLSAAIPMFGQPCWDPIPTEIKNSGWLGPPAAASEAWKSEIGMYTGLSYWMLSALNLKYLPVLVNRALDKREISDYYVFHEHNFCEMLYGSGYHDSTASHFRIESIQELAAFQKGDLMCVDIGAFPAFPLPWGRANCSIMDAKEGILERGLLTVEMCQAVASLPSACRYAEKLLDSNGKS